MVLSDELGWMSGEEVVAYFNILLQHFLGRTEEN
jgi:hypothetical protein